MHRKNKLSQSTHGATLYKNRLIADVQCDYSGPEECIGRSGDTSISMCSIQRWAEVINVHVAKVHPWPMPENTIYPHCRKALVLMMPDVESYTITALMKDGGAQHRQGAFARAHHTSTALSRAISRERFQIMVMNGVSVCS